MEKTKVLFTFDTEDYTSPYAAEAILKIIGALDRAGVRGNFPVVALLARQLRAWGRQDIIDALKTQEIVYHSLSHSMHPTLNELTDAEDFEYARRLVRMQEEAGMREVEAIFGRKDLFAYSAPGNTVSAAALYAFADLGLTLGLGTLANTRDNRGVWFCNLYNVEYTRSFEGWHFYERDESAVTEYIENMAGKKYVIAYTHPNMLHYSDFWDIYNYKGRNKHPFGSWEEPPRRPREQVDRMLSNMELLFRRVATDERFEVTTYGEVCREAAAEPERRVTLADAPRILAALKKRFYFTETPLSLSLCDMILAARDLLSGGQEHLCGRVYGPAALPCTVGEALTVTREEMIASCAQLRDGVCLPAQVRVGTYSLGLADWLYAAYELLCGAENVRVQPRAQLMDLSDFPDLQRLDLDRSWINTEWNDRYVTGRNRLQSYTMRFRQEG